MKKLSIDPVEEKLVRLRALTKDDLALTLSWRNQDEIRKWFFHSDIVSFTQHKDWFANYIERDNDFIFIIEEKMRGNRPVGQVAIYNIDWQQFRCEFGRLMIGDPSARGKGFAKEATTLALRIAFEELEMQVVRLEVYEANDRAIEIYRKCGFHEIKQVGGVLYMEKRLGE